MASDSRRLLALYYLASLKPTFHPHCLAGDMYRLEWPAIWCAYSGAQCVLAVIWEVLFGLDDPRVVGSVDNQKWIEKLDKGILFDSRKHIAASQQKGTAVAYDVMADATSQKGRDQQQSKKAA